MKRDHLAKINQFQKGIQIEVLIEIPADELEKRVSGKRMIHKRIIMMVQCVSFSGLKIFSSLLPRDYCRRLKIRGSCKLVTNTQYCQSTK